MAPCLAPVGCELVQVLSNDEWGEKGDGGADDLVSTADGEGLLMGGVSVVAIAVGIA